MPAVTSRRASAAGRGGLLPLGGLSSRRRGRPAYRPPPARPLVVAVANRPPLRPHVRPGGAAGRPRADTQAGVVPLLRQRRVRDDAGCRWTTTTRTARRPWSPCCGSRPRTRSTGSAASSSTPADPGGSGTALAAGGAVLPRRRRARPLRRRRHRPARHQLQRPGRLLPGQRRAGQGRSRVSTSPSPTPRRRSGPPSPPRGPSARLLAPRASRSRPRCPPPRWPVTWT